MKIVAGIDIGGTAIKIGMVSEEGRVLIKTSVPYDSRGSFDRLVGSICGRLQSLAPAEKTGFKAVGISAPGYAHPDTGVLIDGANNVPALQGRSLTP
ncbi:MAG TPA: hypothetical protein VN203_14795, partial [Candidatus Acidoferrum sp.]|nr:hypothetical protein [Candidatus Acidoferrum sp.]